MNRIAYITLGCKLNYAETSTYERTLSAAGWETVTWSSGQAVLYLVNTCSVTEHSDKKSRNIIRKLHRMSPDAGIVVTGCSAELRRKDIEALEGVLRVFGANEKSKVTDYILGLGSLPCISPEIHKVPSVCISPWVDRVPSPLSEEAADCGDSYFGAYSTGERTRSFLKVQDGCDYKCHYCTVPYARGGSRCEPIADIVKKAEAIAKAGIKEIVITGVNTGDFGKSTGETFFGLLKALSKVEGIERYRISSIEPNLLTEEIVDWIAQGDSRILPHFHIPLQSGCDTVLADMGRRYCSADFASKIDYIRKKLEKPGGQKVFFGIDVIAGFPGESDALFMETYNFLKDTVRPAFIHIFPYSKRPGTPAAERKDQVQDSIKTERVKMLEELCSQLHEDFVQANKGLHSKVLFERRTKDGMAEGWSENYIRVSVPYRKGLINSIIDVEL